MAQPISSIAHDAFQYGQDFPKLEAAFNIGTKTMITVDEADINSTQRCRAAQRCQAAPRKAMARAQMDRLDVTRAVNTDQNGLQIIVRQAQLDFIPHAGMEVVLSLESAKVEVLPLLSPVFPLKCEDLLALGRDHGRRCPVSGGCTHRDCPQGTAFPAQERCHLNQQVIWDVVDMHPVFLLASVAHLDAGTN